MSSNNAHVLAIHPYYGVYVVLEKGKLKWGFPGGGLKKGETPRNGAVREFREETGIHINPNYLVELKTYTHKGGHKSTLFQYNLDPKLNYTDIFKKRIPTETLAFSYAVYPKAASMPYVLSMDRKSQARSFTGIESWRTPVTKQFDFFPRHEGPYSKLQEWFRIVVHHNPLLESSSDKDYIMFVLKCCERSDPTQFNLRRTQAYKQSIKMALKWKNDGIYRGDEEIERYDELVAPLQKLASTFFSGYNKPIHGFRTEATKQDHLKVADRKAWPITLCNTGFKGGVGDVRPYIITPDVTVFPIFLFDREGKAYNECEVIAFSAHNAFDKKLNSYRLSAFDMSRALGGSVPPYVELGISKEEYEASLKLQRQYDTSFCDLGSLQQ